MKNEGSKKVHKGSIRLKKFLEDEPVTKTSKGIQKALQWFKNVNRCSSRFKKGSKGFKRVQVGSKRITKIWEDSKSFELVQNVSTSLENYWQ